MVRKTIIEQEIKSYITALNDLGYSVKKAFVFGSVVNGNMHDYSDIDLAVWSKDFENNYFSIVEKTAFLKRTHKLIELHPFYETDTALTNPFVNTIEQTGWQIL